MAETPLAAMAARRGYLLPHHGLFVLLDADFAAKYDAAYGGLALAELVLTPADKEFAWLVIVATVASPTARHHVRRYRQAGGTEAGIGAALRIAAFAAGRDRFDFAASHWAALVPGWDAAAAEDAAWEALLAETGIGPATALPALLAACTCRRDGAGVARALARGLAAGLAERALAEAMCLTVQPAGLPNLVHAAGIWRGLITSDRVPASPAFRAWAETVAEGEPDPTATPA